MSTISSSSIHRPPEFLNFTTNYRFANHHHKFKKVTAFWRMNMGSSGSFKTRKKEELLSVHAPHLEETQTALPGLKFDRLQVPEKELVRESKFEFGQFVAREAVIDEEYWTAAWLRAESHWEDRKNERYVDNFKRKFAEQEFHALKRRQTCQNGQKCRCIVTVRKEDKNVKRTVLKSVVGTLDLSIRCLLHGETFPGERTKSPPLFCSIDSTGPNRYGYVSNLCVAKSARRQGVASNMLHFAFESAKFSGVGHVYVHMHRHNEPAQELYDKLGFKVTPFWLIIWCFYKFPDSLMMPRFCILRCLKNTNVWFTKGNLKTVL